MPTGPKTALPSCSIADYAPDRSIQATNLTPIKAKFCSQDTCLWASDSDRSPQHLTAARDLKLSTNKPTRVIFDWLIYNDAYICPANLLFTTSIQLYFNSAIILLSGTMRQCLTLLTCSMCHIFPITTKSVWVSLTMLAIATQTSIPLVQTRTTGECWYRSRIIQLCTICASFLTINTCMITSIYPVL